MVYILRPVYVLIVSVLYMPVLFIVWGVGKIFGRKYIIGKLLANYLEMLGPSFIKVGQALASRPDIFNAETRTGLSRLHDRVRMLNYVNPRKLMKASFGSKADEYIKQVDSKPIGSGSVARVYRGELKNGDAVAIKIVNRAFVNSIIVDIRIASFFAKLIDRTRICKSVSFADSLAEIRMVIADQADLTVEGENLMSIRKNVSKFDLIMIPRVIEQLSNRDILTMDFIDGFIPANSLRNDISDAHTEALHEATIALYQMIFEDGLVHADLHSGNIGFSGKHLVLLDFGIVARLNDSTRKDFEDFFYGFVTLNAVQCSEIVIKQCRRMPVNFRKEDFVASVGELIHKYTGKSAGEFQISRFVSELFVLQNTYKMVGSSDFVRAIFSLLSFEGVLKDILPSIDFQLEARIFLLKHKARSFPKRPWSDDLYSSLDIGAPGGVMAG